MSVYLIEKLTFNMAFLLGGLVDAILDYKLLDYFLYVFGIELKIYFLLCFGIWKKLADFFPLFYRLTLHFSK